MSNIDTVEVLKFKAIPIYEKYYSEDTYWGCYDFSTMEDLPYLQQRKVMNEYINDFGSDVIFVGVLAGKMQQLHIGNEYEITATVEYNKRYKNYQYTPISITAIRPKSLEDQKKFLETIVTPNQAKVLLEAYPNIVEDVINGNYDIDLSRTKGIKEYTWNLIKNKIIDNYVIADILIMLRPLGVTYTMIKKLLNDEPNPELLRQKIEENPYVLTKIHGLGFKKVDNLALKLKPDMKVSKQRVYAFLKYYFEDIGESLGHTWVTIDVLTSAIRDNIYECEEVFKEIMEIEKESGVLLHIEEEKVGLKYYRYIENNIFQKLKEINNEPNEFSIDVEKGIINAEAKQGFKFTDEQRKIIEEAVKHNVVLITGKAGTGKSTISRALLEIYKDSNIACAALSAKAAQRITEATGYPAMTIHRLLGANGLKGFAFNQDKPLDENFILLDECSMINAKLFSDFLNAVRPGTKLILVGDDKQLPPIGFGNVFSNLLEKKNIFNVNQLTKVMRQAEKSGILVDANKIREGINPINKPELKIIHGEMQDMYYMFRDSREELNKIAIKTYLKSIKEDGLDNVVIITPRKKDCVNSTFEINKKIQDILIDNSQPSVKYRNVVFKLGAKVIQRQNNYAEEVFNGEVGYVIDVFRKKSSDEDYNMLLVDFNGKKIEYEKKDLEQLEHAYCLTSHLVQGSEYQTAIIIIDNTHYVLLDSCLLYTAITRAKKRCLLLAEPSAFKRCIVNNKSLERQTWMKYF